MAVFGTRIRQHQDRFFQENLMELYKNITVLSLEQATVAPYLTYRLAQDGMNVIRLEHPVFGDPNRFIGENVLNEERMNSYFLCINSGKKALTLNIAESEGQKIFGRLIKELDVDIFVTNQLPKNYQKLGIDYEIIKKIKPDIIWLGLTGFGPESNEAAYDPILQARSGLMELTGEKYGDPQVIGIPLPDMGTSEHGYGLLMKALFKRAVTGEGTRIDMSMFESSASWLTVPIALSKSFGNIITRRGNTHEFFCPVNVYKTQNGFIFLAVGNDKQWKAMVSQDIFKSLAKDEYWKNQGRNDNAVQIHKEINAITQQHSSEYLIEMFNSITVPVSKIKPVAEVVEDPLIKRRMLSSTDPVTGTHLDLAPPPNMTHFLEESHRTLSFPPRFGESNREIYGDILEYSSAELADLKERGII